MKRLRILRYVMKTTGTDSVVAASFVFTLIFAGVLVAVEPSIENYGDALWYCFSIVTTIGFGDIAAVTTLGRVVSVLIGLTGILTIGIVIGVFVAFYNELVKIRHNDSLVEFGYKMEHLEDLSHEELKRMSDKAKKINLQTTPRDLNTSENHNTEGVPR